VAALLVLGSGVLGLAAGWAVDLAARRVPRRGPLEPAAGAQTACARGAGDLSQRRRLPPGVAPLRRLATMVGVAGWFVGAALRFGASAELPAFWVLAASLVALSIIDIEHRVVPRRIVYPVTGAGLVLLGIAAAAQGSLRAELDALLGAAIGFGALLAVHLAKPSGMGFGDVRLGGVIGLYLGFIGVGAVVVALFVSFLLVALAGGALVGLGRAGGQASLQASLHASVPFVPFLAAGALVTMQWSHSVVGLLLG
jgi:leader peptidase (prepilin peptidase)/N-methyltransferase